MTTPVPTSTSLSAFNALPAAEAEALVHQACGSTRWARQLVARRPMSSFESLVAAADEAWDSLPADDRLEAFAHHPRIGETSPSAPRFAATAEAARREQSGMAGASEETRRAFLDLNRQYEAQFGHVFLICATGKTADEMLAQLRQRLNNDPGTELRNAAGEQAKITRLRLEKLISP